MLNLSRAKPHFTLMIGDDGILAVPHCIAADEPLFAAHDDEKARHMIIELLDEYPEAGVTLFADMLAQDYRREALPRLSPFDRPKLIKRRLQQAFPQAHLTASLNLKSRAHILMAGLHGDSPLFDWLERLKTRLPRICLVPVECAEIVSRIFPDARTGWAMMMSRERTGGFRQIVTHQGELIFTRLTPPLPETSTIAEITEALQRDITASLGYLARLGLIDASQLRVALLMPDNMHDALADMPLPVHSVTLISPHKLAQHLDLPFVPYASDPYADLVYAGWLAQKRSVRLSLMTPEVGEAFWQKEIKRAGQYVAAGALAIALLTTGLKTSDLFLTLFHAHQESAQLTSLQAELAETQTRAAPLTEPLGKLREAFERQKLFNEPTSLPWATLTTLNHALGEDARLVKLDWQNDSGKLENEVLQITARLMDIPPTPEPDREQIVSRFQQLTQNLAHEMPDYNIALTRTPFPATPQEPVANNTEKNAPDTAELTLRRAP